MILKDACKQINITYETAVNCLEKYKYNRRDNLYLQNTHITDDEYHFLRSNFSISINCETRKAIKKLYNKRTEYADIEVYKLRCLKQIRNNILKDYFIFLFESKVDEKSEKKEKQKKKAKKDSSFILPTKNYNRPEYYEFKGLEIPSDFPRILKVKCRFTDIGFRDGYMMLGQFKLLSPRIKEDFRFIINRLHGYTFISLDWINKSFMFIDLSLDDFLLNLEFEFLDIRPVRVRGSWKNVIFHNGIIEIKCDPVFKNQKTIKPLLYKLEYSNKAFNLLKEKSIEKLPIIYVYINKDSVIDYQIDALNNTSTSVIDSFVHEYLFEKLGENLKDKFNIKLIHYLYKIINNNDIEIRDLIDKFNNRYVNALLVTQSENYKIVLVKESFDHEDFNLFIHSTKELSFLFTIEYDGFIYIVFENMNEGRSTIYFKVEHSRYYEALLSICSYFSNFNINKRSSVVNYFKRNEAILEVFKVYHNSSWYSHLYRVGYNPLIDKYSCLYKYKQEG